MASVEGRGGGLSAGPSSWPTIATLSAAASPAGRGGHGGGRPGPEEGGPLPPLACCGPSFRRGESQLARWSSQDRRAPHEEGRGQQVGGRLHDWLPIVRSLGARESRRFTLPSEAVNRNRGRGGSHGAFLGHSLDPLSVLVVSLLTHPRGVGVIGPSNPRVAIL